MRSRAIAAICQEQGVVPIVEPEVLMDGSHTIERCEEVTGHVLHAVFDALFEQNVSLEGMLLKPNMVISGSACARQAAVKEVAVATRRCLRRHVPAAVPGIVCLHGGLYAMPSLCGSAEATRGWFRAFADHSFLTCRPL
jgi:fructose-bisphosphate aldolase class I